MEVLVLKFGGTSLGTAARVRTAARRVRAHWQRGRRPVVVVSATGSTTDRLLQRIARLGAGSSREIDRVLATGEDLSAGLLALALGALGVPARSLRGGEAGVLAEGAFGAGKIRQVRPEPLRKLLADGIVPVVSGFQGVREDGETVTLGRGGSDTSAVAIAAALGPVPCHIITDVPAVYDRDPRVHLQARPFREMSHEALLALTEGGAQVVHPRAAAIAARDAVPLRVYHFRAPLSGKGGTRIEARESTLPGLEAVA